MSKELISKYNIAGPRYTSYPTVPYWDQPPSSDEWMSLVTESFSASRDSGISLYIHLPFCESLCTYCGCNTRITVNHAVEEPYIRTVLKEWKMYVALFPSKPRIKEIHLGGGTPTFFSPENLRMLIEGILEHAELASDYEFGFEGHPNYTGYDQMKTLYDVGFRRVSFGVQDFDPKVQKAIHRIQQVKQVEAVTLDARNIGYDSINYDLIYGLPFQSVESIENTVREVNSLKPDRIAFYSYAHVPWIKPGQRSFTEMDLPSGDMKRKLYERGRELLEQGGYAEIGMDHFALKSDSLYKAAMNGSLHRNFMGYTTSDTRLLIGLGVSSISDAWTAFAQNVKVLEEYTKIVESGSLPVFRGHVLNHEDLSLRRHILNIMCRFETCWTDDDPAVHVLSEAMERLEEMSDDQLVYCKPGSIRVSDAGRAFVRNICMALDARLWRQQPESQIFSQTV